MQITVKKGKIEEFPSDIIVVFQFEGTKRLQGIIERVNKASHDLIREIFKGPDFKGKLYQTLLLYTKGAVPAKRILITGLGKRTEFTLEKLRGVGANVARSVRELGLKEFATSIPLEGLKGIILDEISQAFVEGVRLGLYKFDELKSKEKENAQEVKNMTLLEEIPERMKKIKEGAQRAEIIANVVHLTRDMVSRPGNLNTPTIMASIARSMAKAHDLKCKIMEIPEMKKLGMGALLGVAQGSNEPAKFIILEYQGNKRKGDHIVLVGKGITFDSGGISIKPAQDMDRMKSDMAGGAAVMGALQADCILMKIPMRNATANVELRM